MDRTIRKYVYIKITNNHIMDLDEVIFNLVYLQRLDLVVEALCSKSV